MSNGAVNEDGAYVRSVINFKFASCGGKNTASGTIHYKRTTAESWIAAGAFVSGAAVVFGGGNISTEYSFDVRYTLKDTFSSVSIQEIISTAAVVMDFKRGGKGVAVGKVAEDENVFEVSEDWDVRVYGKLLKDYIQQFAKTIYPVGSIYMSVVNTNPSQFFGGTWVCLLYTSPSPRD